MQAVLAGVGGTEDMRWGWLVTGTVEALRGDERNEFDRGVQRKRKRDAVLRAASKAFNRRGFSNTSMDDVAAALGVSKPTVYQYFKSKQEILFECHQLAMEHGEAGLDLARTHPGTGFDKLKVHLTRYMQGIFGDFGTCPALVDVDSLLPEQREAVVSRRATISAATSELIRSGIADGSIPDCDPKLASLFVLGVVNWIPLWYRDTGPNTPAEITDAFIRFISCGLGSVDTLRHWPSESATQAIGEETHP